MIRVEELSKLFDFRLLILDIGTFLLYLHPPIITFISQFAISVQVIYNGKNTEIQSVLWNHLNIPDYNQGLLQ